MTLAEIRLAKTLDELKPAINFLCAHMHDMTYGEFIAYKRTIEFQAINKLSVSVAEINKIAEEYQVYGYERNET